MHTEFGWGNVRERDHLEGVCVCVCVCAWEGYTKLDFQEVGKGAWTGLIWFRIRKGWRTLLNVVVNLQVP